MDARPIGMFDSGFGGLTVARAMIDLLPGEDLVYLGDTVRYPYGSKPLDVVLHHSLEIAAHLVDTYGIKLLVVACNTAAAAALEALQDKLDIPVIGVVEPGVRAALQVSETNRVGVIATVATVASEAYPAAVGDANPATDLALTVAACPGFVELVERGVTSGPEVRVLAEALLKPMVEADVDTLLLGCTHYPYLARPIADVMGRGVVLVSSADETAFKLKDMLSAQDLLHRDADRLGTHTFISSGDVAAFQNLGSRLLGPELTDAMRWDPPSS
jgi:glutamate racemase